jgi:type I restriction enzyme S subunit
MSSLNQNIVGRIPIYLPPMPEQHKIAAVLSAYDDLIENNTRRIQILEEMAQLIYREWFVHFRFFGHEDVEMMEVEGYGLVPSGWRIERLEEICELTMGQSPKSEFYNEVGEGLPFHQGVKDFGTRYPTDRVYCIIQNRLAEAGDILFSVRAPVGRMNLANKRIVIGRGLSAVRSKFGHQAFVFLQLKDRFSEEDMMGGGTIFKSVTKRDMLNIEFIVPPYPLLDRFEQVMKSIFRQIEILTGKNTNLCQTRDLLLPRLICGELDVSGLEIAV